MIHTKLLEIQKLNITPTKNGVNPHFGNSYVTLNEVLEKVKKPLNDAGIVLVQAPGVVDGISGIWTRLTDTEDATYIECFVPFVGATDMQKVGGAITYARRYSLIALLGLEDSDDDGEKASAPVKKSRGGIVDRDDEPFGGYTGAEQSSPKNFSL